MLGVGISALLSESVWFVCNRLILILVEHLLVFSYLLYLSLTLFRVQTSVLLLEHFSIWIDTLNFTLKLTLLPINLLLYQFTQYFIAYNSVCSIASHRSYISCINQNHVWMRIRIENFLSIVLSLLLVLIWFFIGFIYHLNNILLKFIRLGLLICWTWNFCSTNYCGVIFFTSLVALRLVLT